MSTKGPVKKTTTQNTKEGNTKTAAAKVTTTTQTTKVKPKNTITTTATTEETVVANGEVKKKKVAPQLNYTNSLFKLGPFHKLVKEETTRISKEIPFFTNKKSAKKDPNTNETILVDNNKLTIKKEASYTLAEILVKYSELILQSTLSHTGKNGNNGLKHITRALLMNTLYVDGYNTFLDTMRDDGIRSYSKFKNEFVDSKALDNFLKTIDKEAIFSSTGPSAKNFICCILEHIFDRVLYHALFMVVNAKQATMWGRTIEMALCTVCVRDCKVYQVVEHLALVLKKMLGHDGVPTVASLTNDKMSSLAGRTEPNPKLKPSSGIVHNVADGDGFIVDDEEEAENEEEEAEGEAEAEAGGDEELDEGEEEFGEVEEVEDANADNEENENAEVMDANAEEEEEEEKPKAKKVNANTTQSKKVTAKHTSSAETVKSTKPKKPQFINTDDDSLTHEDANVTPSKPTTVKTGKATPAKTTGGKTASSTTHVKKTTTK